MLLPSAKYETDSLDAHMAILKRQVDRSLADPETRQLAVRIVSGAFDWIEDGRTGMRIPAVQGWGRYYHAPEGVLCQPRDDACELRAIWAFLVYNCRYTFDPAGTDTFATLRASLEAGGGDCDDAVIAFAALLKSVGFEEVYARVISSDGEAWEHTYPIVGCPKDDPRVYCPLDITVAGKQIGWQYEHIVEKRDFVL